VRSKALATNVVGSSSTSLWISLLRPSFSCSRLISSRVLRVEASDLANVIKTAASVLDYRCKG
jgi:hypothetical protein